VLGRHEPDTGELNYRFIAKALRDIGYEGIVGLEAYALEDSHQAMERFRAAFSEESPALVPTLRSPVWEHTCRETPF
jgi:hypothetical protein